MASEAELAAAYRARLQALAAATRTRIAALYAGTVGSERVVPLRAIRIDDSGRRPLSEDIIQRSMGRIDQVPPIVLLRDGTQYDLVDGRHRIEAASRLDRPGIRAFVATTAEIDDAFARYIPAAATIIEASQAAGAQLTAAYFAALEGAG